MSNIKRTLITVLAMILVCVISVSATLAYLYDKSESVVNTFSVGNVEISLDEADVDNDSNTADNVTINGQIRDLANEYKLTSGATLPKDPTVHVSKYSEESYIFVEVVIGNDVAVVLDTADITAQMTTNGWTKLEGNIYYYNETVTGLGKANNEDLPVFTTIKVKGTATGDELVNAAADGQNITLTAYAIQADTIKDDTKTHAANAKTAWDVLQDALPTT